MFKLVSAVTDQTHPVTRPLGVKRGWPTNRAAGTDAVATSALCTIPEVQPVVRRREVAARDHYGVGVEEQHGKYRANHQKVRK
jgi:hypothetical protein